MGNNWEVIGNIYSNFFIWTFLKIPWKVYSLFLWCCQKVVNTAIYLHSMDSQGIFCTDSNTVRHVRYLRRWELPVMVLFVRQTNALSSFDHSSVMHFRQLTKSFHRLITYFCRLTTPQKKFISKRNLVCTLTRNIWIYQF